MFFPASYAYLYSLYNFLAEASGFIKVQGKKRSGHRIYFYKDLTFKTD